MELPRRFYCCIYLLVTLTLAQGRVIHKSETRLQSSGWKDFPKKTYEHVEVLILSNSNLHELKPYVFNNHGFYHLSKALLRSNNIKIIHDKAFAQMSKLEQLDLHGNQLTGFSNNSFSGLSSLKHLHLGSNEIRSMDDAVLKPLASLETLDLSHNAIIALERGLVKHSSVLELNLENNPLALAQAGPILESAALISLNLHLCRLRNLAPDAFSMLPKLETLDLSENQLTFLPAGLMRKNVGLSYLDLNYNLISNVNSEAFYLPSNIEELHCEDNPLENDLGCSQLLILMKSKQDPTSPNLRSIIDKSSSMHELTESIDKNSFLPDSSTETKGDNKLFEEDRDQKLDDIHIVAASQEDSLPSGMFNESSEEDNSLSKEDLREGRALKSSGEIFVAMAADPRQRSSHSAESTDDLSTDPRNIMMYCIIGVGIVCLALLAILLFLMYYVLRRYENRGIYEKAEWK